MKRAARKTPQIPENAGSNGDPGTSKAPPGQKRRSKAPKRRSPAASPATAIGTRPAETSPATSQTTAKPEDPQVTLERRWSDATDVGRINGIWCTGSPEEPACPRPAAVAIALHGRLFSLPCREHMPDVLRPVLQAGHDSCRTVSLAHLLELHGQKFVSSAKYIRDFNRRAGVVIPERAFSAPEEGGRR